MHPDSVPGTGTDAAMTLAITPESPLTDDATVLIAGSETALRAHYTAEECFSFDATQLAAPGVTFLVARNEGRAVGCVALVNRGTYGEIRRLYVPQAARGRGVARALMARLESYARAAGLSSVKLETGTRLGPAVRLYHTLGYTRCGPFADYANSPVSTFMEKLL
ncbi:MAG: GNAT family N-acetyltransferase [Rhodobacteraceae bacterium]|nr:GNAT family N-acetyltransferase [Paracoccaceae bacterium]